MATLRYKVTAILVGKKDKQARAVHHVMRLDRADYWQNAKDRLNRAYPKEDVQHLEANCMDTVDQYDAMFGKGAA